MRIWIKMTFKVPFQIHLKKWKNVMLIFLLSIYFLCVCWGECTLQRMRGSQRTLPRMCGGQRTLPDVWRPEDP